MRIVIADDHPLTRAGIRAALLKTDLNQVIGEAANADDCRRLVLDLRPDLLTLDLEMPGLDTVQLARECLRQHPTLRVLVISGHDDIETLKRLKDVALSGFLLKDEAPECLLQAVRTIAQGNPWYSHSISQKLRGLDSKGKAELTRLLTRREQEVLCHIGLGKDTASIASALSLAEQTVRNYSAVIYEKIGVRSRVQAVVWAKERGLV